MLMDLSKDIMMDLGITVVGDIIAILRHAKLVYRQVRSDVFQLSDHIISDYNLHDMRVTYSYFRICAK